MRPLTRLPILLLAGIAAAGAGTPRADFAQADRMLSLLKAAKSGKTTPGQIRAVLDSPGTDLIIRQMNIVRRVTKEQYASLLRALAGGDQPEIRPADSSEKARRGADGLQENVWPSLLWGKEHTDLLEERIATLRKAHLPGDAQAIAQRFLPEKVPISPHVAIVMGGRAGAAALEGSWIYFDVLAMSYSAAARGTPYPSPAEQVEYFAHEIHHLGLSRILERRSAGLKLAGPEKRAFEFVASLVMEGSATYLINEHRDMGVMRRDPLYASNLRDETGLLRACESGLRAALDPDAGDDAYEKAASPMAGNGWHSAGAMFLAEVDKSGGLPAIFGILRDPRSIFLSYNAAVSNSRAGPPAPTFDPALAGRVARLGE